MGQAGDVFKFFAVQSGKLSQLEQPFAINIDGENVIDDMHKVFASNRKSVEKINKLHFKVFYKNFFSNFFQNFLQIFVCSLHTKVVFSKKFFFNLLQKYFQKVFQKKSFFCHNFGNFFIFLLNFRQKYFCSKNFLQKKVFFKIYLSKSCFPYSLRFFSSKKIFI